MMDRDRSIRLFAAALLTGAALVSGAATNPVPWHVQNAELRAPVKVAMKDALLRMPPQVYIADLKPLEITGGLASNPRTNSASRRISGSVTVALKPEYKFYFCRTLPQPQVSIDGSPVPEDRILRSSFRHGEEPCADDPRFSASVPKPTWTVIGSQDPRADDARLSALVAIPPGAKARKIEVDGRLRQAGFITRYPAVAHATLCLPGRDPSSLVPIVHRRSGERVGCRIVWAEAGKPMSILFDSSSGDEDYWVYLVDRAKGPARLDWTPRAGLVEETRRLDRYDPELETLDGFQKLWDRADAIVGKGVLQQSSNPNIFGTRLKHVIHDGDIPRFRPKASGQLNLRELAGAQPTSLRRITAFFQLPATGHYRFFCIVGPGGYVLLDGQLVASFRGQIRSNFQHQGRQKGRIFEMEIEKGRHRLEVLQYAPPGQVGWTGLWWKNPVKDSNGDYGSEWPKFGQTIEYEGLWRPYYMLWEPMAETTSAPLESRAQGSFVSFSWRPHAHLGAGSPGHDLNWYYFSAHAPGCSTNAVYRWRFDDGRTAEGKHVIKLFWRSGMRKVQLEVQDAPGGQVIGRAAGEVDVQLDLDYSVPGVGPDFHIDTGQHHFGGPDHPGRHAGYLQEMIWTFAEEDTLKQLPLDDLVNLYEWSYPLEHWRASRALHNAIAVPGSLVKDPREVRDLARRRIGDMLARRVDEAIAAYPYSQLLQLAQSLSRTENGPTDARYAAAEKLLAAVLDRAPAGSFLWRTAALALSEIKLSVRGETEFAAELLKRFDEAGRAVDMAEGWHIAGARRYHHLADSDKLAGLTQGLDWSPIERTRHSGEKGRGFWLAKAFDLPSNWKGQRLVFNAGRSSAWIQHVWINGEPLGRMWQWQDRNIVIPARLLKRGGKNRITWLLQPYPWPQRLLVASPVLSADLSRAASVHDERIRLDGRSGGYDLGQLTVLGGALNDTPRSLAFSPDGRLLASGHQYGSVRLWDVDRIDQRQGAPKESHMISVGAVSVLSLAFSPDGKRLAAGSEDSRITLLDPVSGKTIRSLAGHASDVIALAFSPDGTRLASASYDRTVKIWDTSSGQELLTLGGHAGPVHAVAYSPDGKSVASAIDDAHIRLWDASTGAALRTLDGQQGEVLSLAFSPDGKRLASGSRDGVVSQWDLDSGKQLTAVHRAIRFASRDGAVTKVLFSLDGKELVPLGGGEGGIARTASWVGPTEGPNRRFEDYPVALYTTEACDEQGMNYACYFGTWDKLPDFEALKPVKTGILKHIDGEHLMGVVLPYWKITRTEDGRDDRIAQPSGLKVTGYLKVKQAGDYTFSLKSRDGSRLVVGAETVIDNDGLKAEESEKHGTVHLEPGVHSFALTYFVAQERPSLNITFPRAFVRTLTRADIDKSRLMAGALLAQGKPGEAKTLLTRLHRGGWPLSEEEQYYVEQTRIRIRRMAMTDSVTDHTHALRLIESSLQTYPMLRLDPEFMVSVISVYARIGDKRAAILADQMLKVEMHAGQRRRLILAQVRIELNEDDLEAAGEVYRKLKALAPQSEELIEARELIKAAVIKRKP